MIKYYDLEFRDNDFALTENEELDYFGTRFIVDWTDITYKESNNSDNPIDIYRIADKYKKEDNLSNTVLVIYQYDTYTSNIEPLLKLNEYGYKKVIIINRLFFLDISKEKSFKKRITEVVYNTFVNRAKSDLKIDFAI